MKVLMNNKLINELENSSNKILKEKTFRYLNEFDNYFKDLNSFNTSKIRRLSIAHEKLFAFNIDPKYRLIFTAEYDSQHELNIAVLAIAKHDDYERHIFKLLNEK